MKEDKAVKNDDEEVGFETEDLGQLSELEVPTKPFDPKKVDVAIQTPNLGALISMTCSHYLVHWSVESC